MAKYKKKRARQLQHDKFRDTTMSLVDRAAHGVEGKGRTILYGLGAVVAIGLIVWGVMSWSKGKSEKAQAALGRAIAVMDTPVVETPVPGSTLPSFRTDKERAQKAVEEFQKVAADYGGSTGEMARYFAATQQLLLDRAKGMSELDALTKSGDAQISTLSRFALAQAKEGDNKFEEAAAIYNELLKQNSIIPADTINLRLAKVYEKMGKRQEAVDLLYKMIETARNAKDKDGKPAPESSAVRKAAQELERLDPVKFAQLPTPPIPENFAM